MDDREKKIAELMNDPETGETIKLAFIMYGFEQEMKAIEEQDKGEQK